MQADTSTPWHFVTTIHHQLVAPWCWHLAACVERLLRGGFFLAIFSQNRCQQKFFEQKTKFWMPCTGEYNLLLPLSHSTEAVLSGQFRATCGFLVDAGCSLSSTGWKWSSLKRLMVAVLNWCAAPSHSIDMCAMKQCHGFALRWLEWSEAVHIANIIGLKLQSNVCSGE